jgi:hypothetical protein
MPTDLRIVLPNRPGTTVGACETLGNRGINIEGVAADLRPGETWGYIHLLVEDGAAARAVLEEAGFDISGEHEVDVFEIENRPGALADLIRRYSEAGENIEILYMAGGSRVVVGTESMRRSISGVKVEDARY